MRYSRNRNDLPKAFSDKVAARIQAERQRSASSQVWCRRHCPGVACAAAGWLRQWGTHMCSSSSRACCQPSEHARVPTGLSPCFCCAWLMVLPARCPVLSTEHTNTTAQASDIGDMQGLDASAFDEGFDSLPSSPYSTDAAPAAGMSALLAQHALLLLAPAAAASGRTHSRCDSADNSMATAGTLADNDSGLMSDFEAAVAAVAAMAAAAPAAAAASGDGRSKSSRARRSTEKVAALQGRQARRSQGLARMATGNEVSNLRLTCMATTSPVCACVLPSSP